MNAETRRLAATIEERGGRVVVGTKHVKVFAADGSYVGILPKRLRPGKRGRAQVNLEARLRRWGLIER